MIADDGLPPLVEPTGDLKKPLIPAAAAASSALAQAPAPLPIAAAPVREHEPKRVGIPPMAWIGIAGAVAFGAVFAVIAAQRFLPPVAAPTAVATVVPPPVPEPHTEPLVIDPPIVEPTEPPTGEADGTVTTGGTEEATEPAGETHPHTGPRRHTGATTPPTPTGTGSGTTSNPTTNAALERFREESGSGPAVIGGEATTRSLRDSEGGAARAELTEDQIRAVVSRERTGLTRCWETAIRGARETPTVRLDVAITIGSSGTVTRAAARGPSVGTLTECIERAVQRWRFPASSGSTETAFPVVFSGTN
jgi:hypothetical protein